MGNNCQEHFFQLCSNYLINNRIIHTTLVLSMEVFEPFVGYYFFNVLLMVLQALHIFWAGLILRMVYKFLKGKVRIGSTANNKQQITGYPTPCKVAFMFLVLISEIFKSTCFCIQSIYDLTKYLK